jgi:hypothetical protein
MQSIYRKGILSEYNNWRAPQAPVLKDVGTAVGKCLPTCAPSGASATGRHNGQSRTIMAFGNFKL